MGYRLRMCLLSLVAIAVMSGIAAVAAEGQQPAWEVGDRELMPNESITVTATGTRTLAWTVGAEKFKVTCNITYTDRLIGGVPGTDSVTAATFAGCVVAKPAGCTVTVGPTAEALPWSSTLVLVNGLIYNRFENVRIKLTLGNCTNAGNNGVYISRGNLLGRVVRSSKTEGDLEVKFPEETIEGDTVEVEGATETIVSGVDEYEAEGSKLGIGMAAGPYWHVAGKILGQGAVKQLKLQAKGVTVISTKVAGLPITIDCNSSISEGATIEGQGNYQGQDKGRFTYSSCKVIEPKECKVAEPITTTQLKSYLAYNPNSKQQKFVDVFEPTVGKEWVTIKLSGGGCKLLEGLSEKITGSTAAEIVPVEKESQEGLLNFPEKPITTVVHELEEKKIGLAAAEAAAVLSVAYGARLATNEQWGVFGQ